MVFVLSLFVFGEVVLLGCGIFWESLLTFLCSALDKVLIQQVF